MQFGRLQSLLRRRGRGGTDQDDGKKQAAAKIHARTPPTTNITVPQLDRSAMAGWWREWGAVWISGFPTSQATAAYGTLYAARSTTQKRRLLDHAGGENSWATVCCRAQKRGSSRRHSRSWSSGIQAARRWRKAGLMAKAASSRSSAAGLLPINAWARATL